MRIQYVLTGLWLLTFLFVAKTAKTLQFATDLQGFTIINELAISCKVSFISCLWVFVLTEQEMLFGWFRRFCMGLVESYAWDGKQLNPNKKATAEYLLKPFLTCEKCTTGNFAFWAYILQCKGNIVILDVLFTIGFSIFLTIITAKVWQR
jgi:hypothetical protein